jgi:serine/threonine-protein kinase
MGVILSAFNTRARRAVALKLLPAGSSSDTTTRRRFRREVAMARRLDHPNAVPVLDAGEHEGELWLEMPLLPGEDLEMALRRDGAMGAEAALAICAQVASALDAAHVAGLIHRDVKPANVRLISGVLDGPPHAYLGDFGLTRAVSMLDTGLTATGEVLGTSYYMSPEQVQGRPLDGRSDIYSLACLLFRCLADAPPYARADNWAVLFAHVNGPVPSLAECDVAVGPLLDAAVARGLAKEPDDRPSTAGQFIAACLAAHAADVRGGARGDFR